MPVVRSPQQTLLINFHLSFGVFHCTQYEGEESSALCNLRHVSSQVVVISRGKIKALLHKHSFLDPFYDSTEISMV